MWGGCIMFGGFLCLFGLLGFWFGGCVLILNMDGIFFIFFWIVGFISKCFGGDFEKIEIFVCFVNLNDLYFIMYCEFYFCLRSIIGISVIYKKNYLIVRLLVDLN